MWFFGEFFVGWVEGRVVKVREGFLVYRRGGEIGFLSKIFLDFVGI